LWAAGRHSWLSTRLPQTDTPRSLKCHTPRIRVRIMKTLPRGTQRALWVALSLLVAVSFVSGCSGINASKSVSPLDFLLPGLMREDPPAPPPPGRAGTLICRQAPSPTPGRFRPGFAPSMPEDWPKRTGGERQINTDDSLTLKCSQRPRGIWCLADVVRVFAGTALSIDLHSGHDATRSHANS